MSSTGRLEVKPQRNEALSSRLPSNAPQPAAASKPNGKVTDRQKKNANKKKSGKGSSDVFEIHGNTINGGTADKAGVFGFGNKYIGRKKQDDSTDEESDSSKDEE